MMRNRCVFFSVLFFLFVSSNALLAADTYPDHEIRIIVGSGVGGSIDRMSRSVQRFLPDILKVPVLVENRKGASGKIALRSFLKQAPDGYTIFVQLLPEITFLIKRDPQFFKMDQIAIINFNWIDPTILVAHKDLGWKSLDDMIHAAKKNPGKYSFSSPGAVPPGTVMPKLLFEKLGLDIRVAPYENSGAARASIRGRHTDMTGGGARGMLLLEDVAVPLGVFWDEPIKSWPTARPVNEILAKYNIKIPNGASYRFFAVHKEFQEKYPERWKILVGAFQKLVTKHKGFQEFCDKSNIGRRWLGPEKSQTIAKEAHELFYQVTLPKK